MPIWLAWLTPVVWKAICRTISVLCVLVVVIGVPFIIHNHGYHKGYRIGYAQAIKDNPSTIINGGTNVVNQSNNKEPFFLFKVWKLRLSV